MLRFGRNKLFRLMPDLNPTQSIVAPQSFNVLLKFTLITGMSDPNKLYDRQNGISRTAKISLKPYHYHLPPIPSYPRLYLR